MFKSRHVTRSQHKKPRHVSRGKSKRSFSKSADMTQAINSESGNRSLMRGGIRL